MRLPRFIAPTAILTIFVLTASPAKSDELSVRLDLPKQLVVEILPIFSAKDQYADKLFQRRHLEKMVEQAPKTKRVALVYFATWCRPCAEGATRLRKAKALLREKGVLTVFVNVGEKDIAAVQKWIKDYGDPEFALIMDTRSQMVGPYGLMEPDGQVIMPKTLVLNEKLKPLFLLGTEGDDFPEILWKYNP